MRATASPTCACSQAPRLAGERGASSPTSSSWPRRPERKPGAGRLCPSSDIQPDHRRRLEDHRRWHPSCPLQRRPALRLQLCRKPRSLLLHAAFTMLVALEPLEPDPVGAALGRSPSSIRRRWRLTSDGHRRALFSSISCPRQAYAGTVMLACEALGNGGAHAEVCPSTRENSRNFHSFFYIDARPSPFADRAEAIAARREQSLLDDAPRASPGCMDAQRRPQALA